MYKLVETPISNNYPSKIVVRTVVGDLQDLINLAVSMGLSARLSGKQVAIDTTGVVSDLDLAGWTDDLNPTMTIVVDYEYSANTTDSTVIVLYNELTKDVRDRFVIEGAAHVMGVKLPLIFTKAQQQLDLTTDALLLELEKLLPDDSPVKILRGKIRNGEI